MKITTFKEFLVESSLSRLYRKTQESTCATISAFRGENTTSENRKLSSQLAAGLAALKYSYTQIVGNYIENKGQDDELLVKELSFFVQKPVDVDDKEFIDNISKLGIKFKQDSVLIIPHGGKDAYLLGTNPRSSSPSLGKSFTVGSGSYGAATTAYLSKVGGREFEFVDLSECTKAELENLVEMPSTINGIRGREILGKQILDSL